MKPTLIAEGRASSLFHLKIRVLATHIIGLMCFLKCQEEFTVTGYTLNPARELPHTVVIAVLEVCPCAFQFSGTCSRPKI